MSNGFAGKQVVITGASRGIGFGVAKGFAAAGTLQPDGTFRLISGRPGNGAVIGSHKVAVMPANPLKAHFPAKYQNAETSGFSVEVKAGKNSFEFDLTSDEGKQER